MRPEGNGHAESGVAQAKHLLNRVNGKYDAEFVESLIEWNNSARADGYSPAAMFMSRTLRTRMPALETSYRPIDQDAAAAGRQKLEQAAAACHDRHATPLKPLMPGDNVLMWNEAKKDWSIRATVLSLVNPRSYMVMTASGTKYRRNREHLRLDRCATPAPPAAPTNHIPAPPTVVSEPDNIPPRRSARLAARNSVD